VTAAIATPEEVSKGEPVGDDAGAESPSRPGPQHKTFFPNLIPTAVIVAAVMLVGPMVVLAHSEGVALPA